jgi:uncharacterized membrane protein
MSDMTHFSKSETIDRPIRTVYDQWTQFEEFPEFMEGVESVVQTDDTHLHWVTEIGLVEREFDAVIDEQVPDQIVSWRAEGEVSHAGKVTFKPEGPNQTEVTVTMAFQPESFLEKVADWTGAVERRVEGDLTRFKEFIEGRPLPTGAHREAH